MTGKISKEQAVRSAAFALGFFMVLFIVLFAMTSANAVVPHGNSIEQMSAIKGKVVAIDPVYPPETLTLQSPQLGKSSPNNMLNIFLNNKTKVTICSKSEPFNDIKVGNNATIKYRELGGVAVADQITKSC